MGIGFRVLERTQVVSTHQIERFKTLPVANVSDMMGRLPGTGPSLRPYHRQGVMAGPALTVKAPAGDNLMLHKAINMAQPGDVIVVDAAGDVSRALMGELMLAYAIKRGVAGFVLNGAIRDCDAFLEQNLPTYAAGVNHLGPYKNGPGEINTPIAINNMVIMPGDLILGDSDGVVCVPISQCDEIYELTQRKHAQELEQLKAIEAGTNDRSWVDAALLKAGCSLPN